eukprot:Em0528g2a
MENGAVVPTYAEAFPPLAPAAGAQQDAKPLWPVKSIPTSTVTQVFHVPLEERRFQATESSFGNRQSEIVCDIMEKTGCSIELSQTKDHTLTIMAHIDLKIPKEHHKNILGKQGVKLKGIEMQTATKISIPRTDDPSDVVKITGTKEGWTRHDTRSRSSQMSSFYGNLVIESQKACFSSGKAHWYKTKTGAKLAFERLALNREYHPFIAGPGGAVAKQISEQTGARINIPPSSLNKNEITVAGDKEAVAKAVAQIQKIYRDMAIIMARCQVFFDVQRKLAVPSPIISSIET